MFLLKGFFVGIFTILLISGCANKAENIMPAYISHEQFATGDCVKLAEQMDDAKAKLAKFSEMQNSKAGDDVLSVFLTLIPVSKLSDDFEADVAESKGVVSAIAAAQAQNKCKDL